MTEHTATVGSNQERTEKSGGYLANTDKTHPIRHEIGSFVVVPTHLRRHGEIGHVEHRIGRRVDEQQYKHQRQ